MMPDVYKRQVLSRSIVELGIYPAVDPLESSSRILDPRIVGEEHYRVARGVQEILQKYKEQMCIRDRVRGVVPPSLNAEASPLLSVVPPQPARVPAHSAAASNMLNPFFIISSSFQLRRWIGVFV